MTPVLSVIIPALAVDLELRRCVGSVRLALSKFDLWELVLVLPASQEAEAIESFRDAVVLVESRPNVYAAMNDGVAASTGRYLYFLGKDDILLPSAREIFQRLAYESPAAVFADVYWGARGVRRGRPSRWKILFENVCHQGIVYSREAITAHGPYLRRFRTHADHLLNIRLLWDVNMRQSVRYTSVPVAWYAATGMSSNTFDGNFVRVQPAIIRRHLGPVVACVWRLFKWFRLKRAKGA